jgi:hypothetical protein
MTNTNKDNQMELTLSAKAGRRARQDRGQRRERAQWWFARMRSVVDAAMEWRPEPAGRPAQVYMEWAAKRP